MGFQVTSPNYTMTPNEFYDEFMPNCKSLIELKIMGLIIRSTLGIVIENKRALLVNLTIEDIARKLKISPTSASNIMKRLCKDGSVIAFDEQNNPLKTTKERIDVGLRRGKIFYGLNFNPATISKFGEVSISTTTNFGGVKEHNNNADLQPTTTNFVGVKNSTPTNSTPVNFVNKYKETDQDLKKKIFKDSNESLVVSPELNPQHFLLNTWNPLYLSIIGVPYPINWGKDSAIAKRILSTYINNGTSPEDLKLAVSRFLNDNSDHFIVQRAHTLADFASRVPNYLKHPKPAKIKSKPAPKPLPTLSNGDPDYRYVDSDELAVLRKLRKQYGDDYVNHVPEHYQLRFIPPELEKI